MTKQFNFPFRIELLQITMSTRIELWIVGFEEPMKFDPFCDCRCIGSSLLKWNNEIEHNNNNGFDFVWECLDMDMAQHDDSLFMIFVVSCDNIALILIRIFERSDSLLSYRVTYFLHIRVKMDCNTITSWIISRKFLNKREFLKLNRNGISRNRIPLAVLL